VPPEAVPYCILTEREIAEDGDEGAAEIYALASEVEAFVTSDVARAIIDLNRAEDDRRRDGVVKTHTCWDVPVYREFPPETVIEQLLARYYRPYHVALQQRAAGGRIRLGIDCHTMAAVGPPIGPGPGIERPAVCLSNADGTCPREWIESLADCFRRAFEREATINDPFKGGFIIRSHAADLPWVQLELSRAKFLSNPEKRSRVLKALRDWCGPPRAL
jgi:formiminoglutamase